MIQLEKYEFIVLLLEIPHVGSLSARTAGPAACAGWWHSKTGGQHCLNFHLVVLADRHTDTMGKEPKNQLCGYLPEN